MSAEGGARGLVFRAALLPTLALWLSVSWVGCASTELPAAEVPEPDTVSRPRATSRVLLGEQLLAQGKVKEAWEVFEEAVTDDPRDARAWLDLGLVYEEVGDWSAARKAYRHATEIDSHFAEAYNNLGVLLRERAELAEAIPVLERAATLDPNLGPARFNLALAYEDDGQFVRAEHEYLAAIQRLPNDPIPRINVAILYLDQDRPDAASDQLRLAAPQVRGDVLLSIAVGAGLRRAGALAEAVDVLREAFEHASTPPPTELLAELALAEYAAGDIETAATVMQRATDQSPRDPALRYALGTILAQRGDLDEAKAQLRRVIKLEPQGAYADRARAQLRSLKD